MNRKQFVLSHGATCNNWRQSWSFVNHEQKFVIFGVWDDLSIIFSDSWREHPNGRKSSAFKQSREHLRLVQEKHYILFTFSMTCHDPSAMTRRVASFVPRLEKKNLLRLGGEWRALDNSSEAAPSEEITNPTSFPEGMRARIEVNSVERNSAARSACIDHHGYACAACDFDFHEIYGDLGHEYIHVHHTTPLKGITKEYQVDPVNDLVPVCPNCHAMIHRSEPCLTVDELRLILAGAREGRRSISH